MKNRIVRLIVVFLFFSFVSHAQNDWKVIKLKSNVHTLKIIDYNVVEHFGEIKKTDVISGEYYLFNESGFITIKKRYGAAGAPIDQFQFEYNDNNSIVAQSISDKEGKLIGKITSEYNELFKKIYQSVYNFDGSLKSRSAYSYTNQVQLKEVVTYDSSGEKVELQFFDYHKRKGTRVETIFNPKPKIKTSTKKFDKHGNLASSTFYDVMEDITKNLLFEYDDNNNLVESQYFDKGVLTTKRNLAYNNLGFLVEEKVAYPLIEKIHTITYAYNFDENGNWIQKIKYVNSVPVNIKERSIAYFNSVSEGLEDN